MKDIEQSLLNNASLDELIRMKIEQEFKSAKPKQEPKTRIITDLKSVPKELIFSKTSTFRVYNRKDKSETFVNGVQAEAMIGTQKGVREKFLDKTLTAFSTEDTFVKFEKAEVKDV